MVKVGFICEGDTEFILLQSLSFKQLLSELHISFVDVINAEGSGNLLPHNIKGYIDSLEKKESDAIIIVTDLDEDVCVTKTKLRINARTEDVVVVSVKKIESWFLACNIAMRVLLGNNNFHFDQPEAENDPFETINNLIVHHTGRGIGKKRSGKIRLVTRLINNGLDLTEAAQHPNCPSARYFIDTLTRIGNYT
jgi:hypothetical protein